MWIPKANFNGTARDLAVGFSIGSKGYLGTGYSSNDYNRCFSDFWEYDPAPNTWIKKANCGGWERGQAVGFSIDGKGYIGTGFNNGFTYLNDLWEYTPDNPDDLCSAPYDGYTNNITSTSATVSWFDSINAAIGYRIYYKEKNTYGWSKAHAKGTSLSKTIKGLQPGTTYVWMVGAKCDSAFHSDFSQRYEFTTLSEKEADAANLSGFDLFISPNPGDGNLTLEITLQQEESLTIKLFDVTGIEMYAENVGNVAGTLIKQLHLNNLFHGSYFIQIIHNGQAEIRKLMIQK
ncbi:MAG: fibronectin type III domain-containing protein [Chitinophagales bacterium]|nr:fibronectin type III domain-containing protein [Chitinophagales bacterium]